MPTTDGRETIDEALARLRGDLTRVRATIARAETNGASVDVHGDSVTEVAYSRALTREKSLEREIRALEDRRNGTRSSRRIAEVVTKMP